MRKRNDILEKPWYGGMLIVAASILAAFGCAQIDRGASGYGSQLEGGGAAVASNPSDTVPRKLQAKQRGGQAYWMLPAPRELSRRVFGTPDSPKRLIEPYVEHARQTVAAGEMPPSVPDLLDPHGPKHGLPLLVGLPMDGPWGRSVVNGKWIMKHGSPFGDKMKPLRGDDHFFTASFNDQQLSDDDGRPFLNTKDSADVQAKFQDPQGNRYSVKIVKTFKPPIPGWSTEGGVLMNSDIGGDTGTFIPLLPRAYSYATVWGIGKIQVNENDPVTRVVVLFITEDIRNANGELALDEEMPLNAKGVQAHLLVPPIEPVPGMGPMKKKVPTAFELPPEAPFEYQPFICVYFPDAQIRGGGEFVRSFDD